MSQLKAWKFDLETIIHPQIFGVPNHHPKSQPFFDHVFTFSVADDRIWFRNFQIVEEDGALAEIGPRFVLNPIKVFESSFSGQTLWDNPKYVTPTAKRCVSALGIGFCLINLLTFCGS